MSKGIFWYYTHFMSKRIIMITLIMLVIFTILDALYLRVFSKEEFIIHSGLGYGQGYIHLLDFVKLLILNCTPIYFISMVMADDAFNDNARIIRLGNFRRSFKQMQMVHFFVVTVYVLLYASVVAIITCIFSTETSIFSITDILLTNQDFFIGVHDLQILIITSILKICELMMLQIFYLIIYVLSKNTVVSFLSCLGLYSILFFNMSSYMPVGISSIQRLVMLNQTFVPASVVAASILVASYGVGYFIIWKKGCRHVFSY